MQSFYLLFNFSWSQSIYTAFGLVVGFCSVIVAFVAYWWRDQPGSRWFVALMFTLGGWTLAYTIQLGLTTKSAQLCWQRIGLAIGGAIPTIWFLFALTYAGKDGILTSRRSALLAAEPFVFGLLVLTNPSHRLIWTSAEFVTTRDLQTVALSLNIGYYIHIVYAYVLIVVGLGYLGFVLTRAAKSYSRYAAVFLLAVLPPVAVNVAYTLRFDLGILPLIDPTPFAFSLTSAVFGVAIYHFDLLERTPIARKQAIDEMGDGLIVLRADGKIIDTNAVAADILPVKRTEDSISALGSEESATTEETLQELHGKTLTATVDHRQRVFDIRRSRVTDYRGSVVGYTVILRDITERNLQYQQLKVTERILRHNLRNEMNIILGMADEIQKTAEGNQAGAAAKIIDRSENLLEVSDRVRTMSALSDTQSETTISVRLCQFVPEILDELRDTYPAATVQTDLSSDLPVVSVNPQLLAIAVTNLVENSIEHNDEREPRVRVSTREAETCIRLRVEDNGPGIPASEQKVIEDECETPLQHGSGLGLWLVNWSAKAFGGSISFSASDLGGSTVTLEIPIEDADLLSKTGDG